MSGNREHGNGTSPAVRDIDEYLDLLFTRLRTTPREARRILAEAEDHLREAVADGLAAGMTEREAHQAAISSFGSVRAVARAHNARHRFPEVAVFRALALSACKLASAGLFAVAASGVVAAVMNAVLGPQFVGRASAGARFPAAACRYWQQIWPDAHGCAQAALLETSSDAVSLRLAAGLGGLVLLAGYLLARRKWRDDPLPDGFVPTVAVTLFGAAGAGLTWLAVAATRPHPGLAVNAGPGFYASGAIVSVAMAVAYLWPLRRTLLRTARG